MELKKLSIPAFSKNYIALPIPSNLIQQRDGGGGKKLSYISGSTVIDMLNYAFGHMWDWVVEKEWIEEGKPFFNTYTKSTEKIKFNGKEGAWESQGAIAHVRGQLLVYLDGGNGIMVKITKTGYGSKSILGKQNDQESIYKAAGTDALKKAASLLGIGAELYRESEEQEYFEALNYEDPWTDAMKANYAVERQYISDFMSRYELDADGMTEYVADFSANTLNSLFDILPDNIESFVEYLKAVVASAEEQKE